MNPQYEFWRKRHDKALDIVAITERQLLNVQAVGQMSLFKEVKVHHLTSRRGLHNDYDDFADTGGDIVYPDFNRPEPPDLAA